MVMPEVSSDSEEHVYAVVEDLQGTHQIISIYHYVLIDDYSCAYFNDQCLSGTIFIKYSRTKLMLRKNWH